MIICQNYNCDKFFLHIKLFLIKIHRQKNFKRIHDNQLNSLRFIREFTIISSCILSNFLLNSHRWHQKNMLWTRLAIEVQMNRHHHAIFWVYLYSCGMSRISALAPPEFIQQLPLTEFRTTLTEPFSMLRNAKNIPLRI